MTRIPARVVVVALLALAAFAGLVALGTWQVHRRAWKHALIARVEARIHAAPVAAPGPADWAAIDAGDAEYRRVRVTGRYLPASQALVQAVTARGAGWWAVAALRSDAGFVVLVNRGFVAARPAPPPPADRTTLTGLLRVTEPGGGFLRRNDPLHDRWYSRDVAAIARARMLGRTAPYFIDADAGPAVPGAPVGGLTVVTFADNHLVYALTWYALAMMVAAAFVVYARKRT